MTRRSVARPGEEIMSTLKGIPAVRTGLFILLGALSWLAAPAPTAAATSPWVSAYYAGYFWDWQSQSEAIAAVDMTTMTHFIFARYAPGAGTLGGSAGQLLEGAGTGHAYVEDALVAKAHANGVKALAMLGGAGDGGGWVASTAPAVRATFINNILNKCVAKNYDGVDVDWEESLDTAAQQDQLIAFLSELRAAAAARPRYQAPNAPFLITFPGFVVNINYESVAPWKVTVASLVDQYNLMSYSMTWNCCGWDTWLWAALKDAGPTHPTSIESSIQAYVDAGVPRSKMGMGLGLYASGYAAPVTGPRQAMSTQYFWSDYSATWADLYKKGMLSSGYQFDTAAQTGYYTYSSPRTYQGNAVTMVITEDLQSIAAKGAWAKAGNCGGTIVWVINYGYVDTAVGNPPMQAVKQGFLGTSTAYTLTVAKAGAGTGTVTSSPAGINCGAGCSASFAAGTAVALTATPAAGSAFSGWSGACTGAGSCSVTMNAAKSVTATFSTASLSINDVTVTEGNSGTKSATFTVTLSAALGQAVTVNYATANGTATAGADYAAASGPLTFAAGQTSKTVAVSVSGDTAIENDETLTVTLSGGGGVTLADAQGLGTLTNDDFPTLAIGDVTLNEGNSGTTNAVFTVSASAPSPQTITVNYATANGTATAGSDYAGQTGNLTFTAGQTSKTITVVVNGDTTMEPNETFVVNLSAPGKAALADAQGQGTITSDDSAPVGEPVVWTDLVGVTAAGNTLSKASNAAWGDAGAASTRGITSGDGYGEFTLSASSGYAMFGLSNGNSGATYSDIDYAFYTYPGGGTVWIGEKGVSRGSFGAYAAGDKLRVSVSAGTVKYYRNATLLYTSAIGPTYPLRVDSWLYSPGATVQAVLSGTLVDVP
jgi:hypothetical protein